MNARHFIHDLTEREERAHTKRILDKLGVPAPRHGEQRPRELRFKDWVLQEAKRRGLSRRHLLNLYYANKLPPLKLRRVNARVVYVVLSAP